MRVRTAHISLQYSDTDRQHTEDIEKIFERAARNRYAWITGTEAGPGAGNISAELVRVARAFGYRPWVPSIQTKGRGRATDCWIAVRRDLVKSGWDTGFRPAIQGSQQLYASLGKNEDLNPRWGPKGLVTVEFFNDLLGEVHLGAAHYLTKARDPKKATIHGVNHWEQNEKLAEVVADWAREQGRGSALCFYAGDQNMNDALNNKPQGDTFFGGPFTSLADELQAWQNTGHGPIDVIASYNKDNRVTGHRFTVLDDKDFFLHGDHFLLEGVYTVEPLKPTS